MHTELQQDLQVLSTLGVPSSKKKCKKKVLEVGPCLSGYINSIRMFQSLYHQVTTVHLQGHGPSNATAIKIVCMLDECRDAEGPSDS